jgi:hypothetical protein
MPALLALAAVAAATAAPAPAAPQKLDFADALAHRPTVASPSDWVKIGKDASWAMLARSKGPNRQPARWAFAAQLISHGHSAEALGVLDVMLAGDPDLALVPSFQIARGAALVGLGRDKQALDAMTAAQLRDNPEACAWRTRALEQVGRAAEAVHQMNCAIPAINGRAGRDRRPFGLAGVRAALKVRHPEIAMQWLSALPDADPQADVLRGQALAAMGKLAPANQRFQRAEKSSDLQARADARLSRVEASLAAGKVAPSQVFDKLDAIRFSWRGDGIERRDLDLAYSLAQKTHDVPRALQAGATLLRYFDMGSKATPLLAELQAMLSDALAPNSSVPIASAAGIYWEYRDFAPAGADGDALAMRLADRLQAAGLPARAAELVQYQLEHRAQDVARGPLSVRVAMLHILAGHPDRALEVLRTSEDPNFTDQMRWDRKRMEAVALFQLGKPVVAEAALQDVPGASTIRAEIAWKTQNWARLASGDADLPAPRELTDAGQAQVLRYAIALAMLGREDGLGKLRTRYEAAFQSLPSAGAFDVLTRSVSQIDPGSIEQAMAAIPTASPAGAIGDLLEVRKSK